MAKAQELRRRVEEQEEAVYDKQLDQILTNIEQAVNSNKYFTEYKYIMCDTVRRRLEADNLQITTHLDGRGKPIYVISW